MKYCKKCVQPDTRPGIVFSLDGTCGACLWEEEKEKINWMQREQELIEIAKNAKLKGAAYDCAIGVSGGKDSTVQALYARDVLNLRPLLVNCEPMLITQLGRENIENLKKLGFDTISIRPNPVIMKKLMIRDFFVHLNPLKVTEYALWASTYIIADKFDIPLVIQGENPGLTLGVKDTTGTDGNALNADLQNTIRQSPFVEYKTEDYITDSDLFLYRYNKKSLIKKGIKGVWLSYYYKDWSQPLNAKLSIKNGMKIRKNDLNPYDMGNYRLFSALDTNMVYINQMFKHIKLGFGQTTDAVCYDIREGLITRDEGIYLVKELDGKCGDQYITEFCNFIGITISEFWENVNKFRGDMWQLDGAEWKMENPIWEQNKLYKSYDLKKIIERLGM